MAAHPSELPAPHIGPALGLPLAEELVPAPDPWDAARRLAHLPHLLFLDSADARPGLGWYSFVAADPVRWLTRSSGGDPFAALTHALAGPAAATLPGLPPFQGGVAGLFGYGLGRAVEHIPRARRDEFAAPDLAVGVYDWVVSFDHEQRRAWVVSTGFPQRTTARAAERLG